MKKKHFLVDIVLLVIIFIGLAMVPVEAARRTINFIVGYKVTNFAGKNIRAIAINNQIPGPTLHFTEGDKITIRVYNQLDQETAIHWHGMILPWQMDGVLGVTQKGIQPGGEFTYQFTVRQSGTYWYHAHAGLQEQLGLYGALLIDPIKKPQYHYDKDFTIVLSDWSNTQPNQILANLKKEGDYYSPKFPLQPSLMRFIQDYQKASLSERSNLVDDYKMMQQMRMSIYDLSDVAYDAFLLNGQTKAHPWARLVKVGDVVRLRFIGAAASTLFHVKIPGSTMQMIQVEGNDVMPYTINDFKIAPGETYDVLVKIQNKNPHIIYAESIDTVGAAYGILATSPDQVINLQTVTPFPLPKPAMREMMALTMNHEMGMSSMSMDMSSMQMDHAMQMQNEPSVMGDSFSKSDSSAKTIGTKYQNLKAAVKTNNPNKSVDQVIKMELFGYMDKYIWFINGVPEYNAHPIILEPDKRYRFVFTNPTMMHHPMHLHGHWFILRNGHGSYDPLLHTIDIPPGGTVTADIDTDASGQWLFHCHLLYHMMSGMSRVFQYSTLLEITQGEMKPQDIVKKTVYHNRPIVRVDEVRPINMAEVHHPMAHDMGLFFANFLDFGVDPFSNTEKLTFKALYGRDYNKLELFSNDAEIDKSKIQNADIDIFYWHLLNQFWAIKGGINYFYRPALTPYWQPGIGIEGLMPYFIETDVRGYYYSGSTKLDAEFSRASQITNNFFIKLGIRGILASKTINQAQIGSGLNQMRYIITPYYRLIPGLNIFAEFEHQKNYGSFRKMQIISSDSAIQNTLTIGFSLIF